MSTLALKGNIKRGWPNPSIVEYVLTPDVSCAVGSATPLQAFMVGHADPVTNKAILGVSNVSQEPLLFRNNSYDPDSGSGYTTPNADSAGAAYGGIQSISMGNPLLVQTSQFVGTPAVDQELFADVNGKLTPAVSGSVVVARCKAGAYPYQSVSYIDFRPVAPYVKA